MPRERQTQHVEATPHFDGQRESIINDSTASAGEGIGITFNNRMEFSHEINPFNFVPKESPDMEKLGKLLGGKKIK